MNRKIEPISFHQVMQWSDDQCRAYLESKRWSNGPICPKCGVAEPYTITRKSESKNLNSHLYKCRACKKQFTATIGTIFEDSKIPLNKWFAAIYLMCASKKGMSAHQLHRELDITYKSAWFMCHRVRESMRDKTTSLLSGTVEADETYVGGRPRGHKIWKERIQDEIQMGIREKPKHPRMDKAVVFGMVERGGQVRTMVVSDASAKTLVPLLTGNIDVKNANLMTDSLPAYRLIRKHLPHQMINHEVTYVEGDVHTQNIEGYWSILKRGLYGTFHHVDARYLPSYLSEFEFRFNRRKIADEDRFASLVRQTQGRLLWFCETEQPQNPHA